jgi:hypothetical protein
MEGTTGRGARLGLIAAAAMLLLAGCGRTAKEAVAENTPAVQALRAKLNTVVGGLPSFGSAVSMSMAPVDPKPVYDRKTGTFNTAFVSVEQLKDDSAPAFDLILESDLSNALAWSGSRNPMAESRLNEPAGDLNDIFERALKTPYVVIYRTISFAKPIASADGTSFDGGMLDLEAYVVPVERNTWVASCRIAAESDTKVSFSMKKGEDPKEKTEAFAQSTLWQDARKQLAACLAEQTGGTFQFDAP